MLASPQQPPIMPHSTQHNLMSIHQNGASPNGLGVVDQHKHIWIITGPAGCGKSTVAQHLAQTLALPYIEGDEFHPPANIDKMAAGVPLTDADRWDWLILLRQEALARFSGCDTANGPPGVVLTCSALKKKYRDVIRVAAYHDSLVCVHFVYLRATEEVLMQRVKARQGHYMKDSMVKSQFASLEEPTRDEGDCLIVDVAGTMPEVQDLALTSVKEALKTHVAAENDR
ncbi:hypothetical protein FH972_022270 [Carpinus fangiana]|uniref:Gluconokinase n=1 Tax=Carpinus fangiana TaxID=176857 RepID=A0A5N6KS44_9ROSI|nr:hypothetical protein FH972_022270 [Carpinus fangiana]